MSTDAIQPNLVSVIVPTYNRAHLVASAVQSALAQTYASLEVVVVDDGSTDDTRAVVEALGPRVRYIHQANAGVSAARNTGMAAARGELIAFLDSDDSWRPWKLEAQVAALQRCPEAGIVWSDMAAIGADGHVVRERHLRTMYSAYTRCDVETLLPLVDSLGAIAPGVPAEWRTAAVRTGDLSSAIMLGNLLHTSTVLFRRTCLERAGGFDLTYPRTGEDYEFYVRLTQTAAVVFVDAPTTVYRVGAEDQLSSPAMMREIARNDLRTIRKWLPRRAGRLDLPPNAIRNRIAGSLAWVGYTELDTGHNLAAADSLCRSLLTRPDVDERLALLLACALPASARRALARLRRNLRAARAGASHS